MALKSSIRARISADASSLSAPLTATAAPAVPSRRERKTAIPASRQGLVPFGFFVPAEARKQVKGWAGLNGRTTQEIGQEMMDDWFAKHGLHRLAGFKDTER